MKIYSIGDSHSILYDKSELVENYFWLGGMTMHRVGTRFINFSGVECDPLGCGKEVKSVPTDGIVLACFGEIDVRHHVFKQVCLGRNEDEILCTLVSNYIILLKLKCSLKILHGLFNQNSSILVPKLSLIAPPQS